MLKIVFILIFLVTFSNSDILELNQNSKPYNTSSSQKVYEDKNHNYNVSDILYDKKSSNFTKNISSYTKSIFWTKSYIKNKNDKTISTIFRNNRAGIDHIDVYIYNKDKELVKSFHLGDLEQQEKRRISGNRHVFHMEFKPNEKYYIITKYKSLGSIDMHWDIISVQKYSYISTLEYIFWGFFAGIVIALILYNSLMFFSLKNKAYLYYVLHGFFILCFIYAINGIFYLLNIGIDLYFLTLSTWLTPPIFLIFINLFTKEFFKVNEKNKFLNKIINAFLIIHVLFLLFFLSAFHNPDILQITPIFLLTVILNILFIALIGVWGVTKKIDGAVYFLIGESLYLSSLLFVVLFTFGIFKTSYLSNFIFPTGILLEIIFLAVALSSKIAKIKKENDKKEFLLSQEKSVTEIGKTIKNLSHQFRQPLSYISSQFLYLETLYNLNKKDKIIKDFISIKNGVDYSINCMSETLSLFSNFYNEKNELITIKPKDELDKLLEVYKQRIILNNINFDIVCSKDITFKTFKGYFSNVISIFLENSIESFELNKIKNPQIKIVIKQNKDITYIHFKDNGIGIKKEFLKKIFEPHFTTKQYNYGLGLNIAKVMIEEKLKSKIDVKSENNETIFSLKLIKLF